MKYFDLEFETTKGTDAVRREFLAEWTGLLADWGYSVTSQSDDAITFHRKYRSVWVILGAIFLFPIGLLFLLITRSATITAVIERDSETERSVLSINGRAPRQLRRDFEGLQL